MAIRTPLCPDEGPDEETESFCQSIAYSSGLDQQHIDASHRNLSDEHSRYVKTTTPALASTDHMQDQEPHLLCRLEQETVPLPMLALQIWASSVRPADLRSSLAMLPQQLILV